jgi:hypothetical protein
MTAVRMNSYLDHLPSQEREKIRKRLRSPEEYERLREKVRGPEDLEREMERNAEFAEARLALESDPGAREQARDAVRQAVAEQGIDAVIEGSPDASAVEQGNFEVIVDEHGAEPRLAVQSTEKSQAGSGNVAEVFGLRPAIQQQILSSISLK